MSKRHSEYDSACLELVLPLLTLVSCKLVNVWYWHMAEVVPNLEYILIKNKLVE